MIATRSIVDIRNRYAFCNRFVCPPLTVHQIQRNRRQITSAKRRTCFNRKRRVILPCRHNQQTFVIKEGNGVFILYLQEGNVSQRLSVDFCEISNCGNRRRIKTAVVSIIRFRSKVLTKHKSYCTRRTAPNAVVIIVMNARETNVGRTEFRCFRFNWFNSRPRHRPSFCRCIAGLIAIIVISNVSAYHVRIIIVCVGRELRPLFNFYCVDCRAVIVGVHLETDRICFAPNFSLRVALINFSKRFIFRFRSVNVDVIQYVQACNLCSNIRVISRIIAIAQEKQQSLIRALSVMDIRNRYAFCNGFFGLPLTVH